MECRYPSLRQSRIPPAKVGNPSGGFVEIEVAIVKDACAGDGTADTAPGVSYIAVPTWNQVNMTMKDCLTGI
ncbi:hypothetical protein PX554_20415 [Sphingomonas sp. H39-1-10]|uniref:hypothetical protein n=1 Tax=Sphingomonas pollutisoli TaxID=3030829 RepID=UPI0023B9B788|nr:hypothetical protein [Sphingomonas pollutisoli]MDF0490499.1 hypothetical protein [Sphingomonas pollutisoli]